MNDSTDFDVVIIGGGQAGVPLAWALAEAGKRVALAEQKDLGGSCVNFGCTPTKAAIASARVAHLTRRASEFGLKVPTVEVDFPAVLARARHAALVSREGLNRSFEGSENPKLLRGHAQLAGKTDTGDRFRVQIGDSLILASQVVLNSGTRTLVPPVEGLDQIDFLHSENWLYRPELPSHLAIMGGGYIGLEMAQFYCRMGSQVTVIQRGHQLTDREDPDVASEIQRLLEAEGIVFHLDSAVTQARNTEQGVRLRVQRSSEQAGEFTIDATQLFVAVGRRPNTEQLGLETVGVQCDSHGFVQVDPRLASNVEGIWAAGDVRGGPLFTHTSWDDNRILQSQMLGDGKRTTDRIVPYAIFIDPELGRVGLTETQARASNREIKVARFDMSRSGKAAEIGETAGFIKVIVDAHTDRIIGAAVLSTEGAELVHIYVNVMNADAPYTVIRDAIQTHPTLAEAIQSAVTNL